MAYVKRIYINIYNRNLKYALWKKNQRRIKTNMDRWKCVYIYIYNRNLKMHFEKKKRELKINIDKSKWNHCTLIEFWDIVNLEK